MCLSGKQTRLKMEKLRKALLQKKILVLLLIVVAAFMRLYRISEYMTFLGDEGRDVMVVWDILHGNLTLLGPRASAGDFFLGPIYYYMIAPFLLIFNYHPVGPAIMVALMGVLTVYLVFCAGKIFFGETAGFIAALFYALSPIVIAYSRSSWNPNPMPLFSLLTLLSLLNAQKEKNWKFFILSGFFLGISMQLHYLTTFLGAIVFMYILISNIIFRKKTTTSKWLSALFVEYLQVFLGFLAGLSLFLLFEVRHGFPNTKTIFSFIFKSGDIAGGGKFYEIVADVAFRLFGRLIANFPPPEQISVEAHPNIALWYYSIIILGFAACFVFVSQLLRYFKSKEKDKIQSFVLVLLWAVVGVLLFGFYKKSIYDYYFGFLFPVPFLLVGNFLSFLILRKGMVKVVGVLVFVTLLVANISANPFRLEPNNQYGQVKKISDFVMSKTDGKSFNFALITLGNSDHAYRYFFQVVGKSSVTILNPEIDPQRKSVTDQLLVVCEQNCSPLGNSLWEVAGFGQAEIVGQWPLQFVNVYKLVHYKGKK